MFWGLVVQPNKKYSKTVSTPFHVSQAVLDVATVSNDAEVQLILKSDKVDYILCILKKSGIVQVPLDLIFSEGDDISFRSVGGTVHLTGYLVDDQNLDGLDDDEKSDGEEEVPQLVDASRISNKQKRKLQAVHAEQDSSSENENSDESQGEEEASDEDDDDEGDDDDDDDGEEDLDDSDEESAEPPPAKISKTNGMANGVPKKAVVADGKPKKQQPQQQNTDKTTKQLQGGVKVDDLRVGQGSVAKAGKKVQVFYEGRFKSNNKVFDKTNTGKGFEFILGKGEVIKGWDVGIQGMKVGGKRRILCPPQMAYGSKGAQPTIPPNSTLVFEVELRNVN